MSDWWNQPMDRAAPHAEGGESAPTRSDRVCPWCSAVVSMDSPSCPSCGAVIAQRESLGGVVIPGVTDVDAGLAEPSLTHSLVGAQARMTTLNAVGRLPGGTALQVAAAAGMLARDSFGGVLGGPPDPASVGQPSEAALEMARRLDTEPAPATAQATAESVVDEARDPWRQATADPWAEATPQDPAAAALEDSAAAPHEEPAPD